MDSHLVAVKVSVVRRANERVDLDRLALDEDGLEGLDAEAVKRRGAVEQDGVLLDDLIEESQTSLFCFSTIFFALLMVVTWPRSSSLL